MLNQHTAGFSPMRRMTFNVERQELEEEQERVDKERQHLNEEQEQLKKEQQQLDISLHNIKNETAWL